ncbi:MAG: hypothetical protein EZS28_026695 [Streblomastix strix]|uniref:Uncharacterized protein n=1 Tax=Streblomastix strix TaxID=222440 RepID=A0A5J4V4R9_9EUKA|nr:MAG: hypothetical protein EZS28_026695 [Streblomastix strix]
MKDNEDRGLEDNGKKNKNQNKMQSKLKVNEIARAIVSFTDSYTLNKQGKQNEQPESESISSLTDIASSLQTLSYQIRNNNTCKQVIQIPKLLKSLVALSRFRLGTHIDLDVDNQRLEVRSWSRWCLYCIQCIGDEQDQSELVNKRYGRVTSITFSTAGAQGEEQDEDIRNGLCRISAFLNELHEGRNNDWQPSFQPLPLLARNTEEQMEEEGADEEIDAQMKNNGDDSNIKGYANYIKEVVLNHFIHRG